MKKALSMLLCLVLILSLAACGKGGKTAEDGSKGEIDKYAEKGEIPEFGVKLGSSHEGIVEYYNDLAEKEDNEDLIIGEAEGILAVNLSNGVQSFYYEKQYKEQGASVFIVTGGTAYGFELGEKVTKSDVTAKLAAEYTLTDATPDQLYFLPGTVDGAEVLSCSFDKIRLDFFFFDGILSAISLTNTEYWTD